MLGVFTACGTEETTPNIPESQIPVVQSAATYDMVITENIVYAEGLSHDAINSTDASAIPLFMDAYVPINSSQNRPALLLIHGGGFKGGSKQQDAMVNMARYFAERGWVAFSIDYRLQSDLGTIPQAWVDYAGNIEPEDVEQYYAIYPAHRDAKAALRWIIANANLYDINTDYITVGGGSAGAITAIGISISEASDYNTEIDQLQDPTLATSNPSQSYTVQTILDFWGSDVSIEALELIYGYERFDANVPALFIAHGTEDPTVLFEEALQLQEIYESNQVPYIFYELSGLGHGVWNATVDGRRLEELAFDFVIEQQGLILE